MRFVACPIRRLGSLQGQHGQIHGLTGAGASANHLLDFAPGHHSTKGSKESKHQDVIAEYLFVYPYPGRGESTEYMQEYGLIETLLQKTLRRSNLERRPSKTVCPIARQKN